ncbi:hypothetical protein FQN54_000928 [Arachnomyces sp. PD_36]|nr:hypothetical protein FQN54_000928 [Arachnomyces sp. PD_36]
MALSSPADVATALLSGNLVAILVTFLIALSLPLLLHFSLYRSSSSALTNDFILLGPSGGGKTCLFSLLERKSSTLPNPPKQTHTSQSTTSTTITLPPTIPTASNRFRSTNDESSKSPTKYQLTDTPGHGKLRSTQGTTLLSTTLANKASKSKIRGVIYVVDASALAEGDEHLRTAAGYLHDTLLVLQRHKLKNQKAKDDIPVLVAANKQDLFTALPPGSVRAKLEAEIEKIRRTRSRGLLDPSVGTGPDRGDVDEEEEILGGSEVQGAFSFKMLEEEVGVRVEVVGGAGRDDDESEVGDGVRRWEEWIGGCL